jgi:DNA polymerase-4
MDCDAFYASVEKRDNPELRDRPLIVGGGRRGVVSTCCYIARVAGVRSAMPMFKALKICPDAVIVKPRMEIYSDVGREIRNRMRALTPMVEPLSLDEAFLDLKGTERLMGRPAALSLAALAQEIEKELDLTISIGLSHNKYLAKIASDLDKPRGFSVIGKAETLDFLADRSVRSIWGVGKALAQKLEDDGLRTNMDLRNADPNDLLARYGSIGKRLFELSQGIDTRQVSPNSGAKSISSETTFDDDVGDFERLSGHLWRLSVRTSDRAKAKSLAGRTVVLKLKTAEFRSISRQAALETPTNLADVIYSLSEPLLERALERGPFRLIGVGLTSLGESSGDVGSGLLFEDRQDIQALAEAATDKIRTRFGKDAIRRGRALR